jgi:hypothetical protein
MKNNTFFLMSLFALLLIGSGLKAQEVTVDLYPGWNWICYPYTWEMDVEDALGDFEPVDGDHIKSQTSTSFYLNGIWRGGVNRFKPGCGYMYFSTRTEMVSFVFAYPSPVELVTDAPSNVTPVSAVAGGTVMLQNDGHVFLRGVCWGTSPNPDINGNHISNDMGVGSFSSTLWGLQPNTTYYVRSYAVTEFGLVYGEEVSFSTPDANGVAVHEYVDLGLPSGIMWATCNVGADAPEDYGDYFAWGETQPKSTYNWNTYQYCMGTYTTLTKYCINASYGYNGYSDVMYILLPEDDAASANWGSDWHTPSKEEWQELYQNTTHTWTTRNGVNGRLFTASNGNSIFLPATGYRSDGNLNNVGTCGYYWSNWVDMVRSNDAKYFCFNTGYFYVDGCNRRYGSCVRPVRPGYQY